LSAAPPAFFYEKEGLFMEKIMTYETLRNFAYSNDALCHTPIRGIVLTFNGLGFSTMVWDDESPIDQEYASQGIIHVIPYYNPWCWMNRQAVDYVDEIVDVLFGRYALEDTIPIIATGGSMGGLCALVYSRYAKRTPTACLANCPVCDLPYHYTERPDLPHTLYSAFATSAGTFEAALRSASPIHLVDELPDIPYYIFHCEEDKAVNKERHSDVFVKALSSEHTVEYYTIPGRGHCDLSPEMHTLFRQKILESIEGTGK